MARFMLLYEAPRRAEDVMANSTPEEMEAGMTEWLAWKDRIGGDDVLEWGMPVQARAHLDGGGTSPSTSQASGYSILTADSLDDAVAMAADHPHLKQPGTSIEVLELISMPGF